MTTTTTETRQLLDRRAAAEFLGVAPSTLAKWFRQGRGPTVAAKINPHLRTGRPVYLRSDLESWVRAGCPLEPRPVRPASWPSEGYGPPPNAAEGGRFTSKRREPATP